MRKSKRVFFKAFVSISTESLWLNKQGEYEGIDPNTYQDHGITQTFEASTLEKLKEKISKDYFYLDKPIGADVQIFENRIEITYEGEHDYRTPKKEQIPFVETATILIQKITSEDVNLSKDENFKNIENH